MRKVTRKQICRAFENAVPHLAPPTGPIEGLWQKTFICYAIDDSTHPRDKEIAKAAKLIIHNRIEGCGTVRQWLYEQGIRDLSWENQQEYRHRWLQSLIEEFSS